MIDDLEHAIEAMLFASDEPLDARQVAGRLGDEMTPDEVRAIILRIAERHDESGIELVERGGHWHFQTPADLAHLLRRAKSLSQHEDQCGIDVVDRRTKAEKLDPRVLSSGHVPTLRSRPARFRPVAAIVST